MNRTQIVFTAEGGGRRRRFAAWRAGVMALVLATAALMIMAGCRSRPPPGSTPPALSTAGFVRNPPCAPCHSTECQAFAGSRHAITLRAAKRADLGEVAPPLGAVPLAG